MNAFQVRYIEVTPGQDISAKNWAMLSDATDVNSLESLWTSQVLYTLRSSTSQEDLEAFSRLSRQTKRDRAAIFQAVIVDLNHLRALRPIVSRQEIVVAEDHTDELERTLHRKRKLVENQGKPVKRVLASLSSSTASISAISISTSSSTTTSTVTSSDSSLKPEPTEAGSATGNTIHNKGAYRPPMDSPKILSSGALSAFEKQAAQKGDVWTLKTGTVVDDVIVEYARSSKAESAAHSFIFDTSNPDLMERFSEEEQDEILAPKRRAPENDPDLVQYLMTFNHSTMKKLRTRLRDNDADQVDDNKDHLVTDRRWVYKTVLGMADVFDGSRRRYRQVQTERWLELHLWRLIDEHVFDHPDIQLVRGESTSMASTFRKNGTGRGGSERKKMGRRIDGLYVSCHQDMELGGIELGMDEQDAIGTKYQYDGLKLQKLLKDQLDYALLHSTATKTDFETLGLQLSGRTMQILTMDWVGGKFYRFRRESPEKLPLDASNISDLLVVMSTIMRFHARMQENAARPGSVTSEELSSRLLGSSSSTPKKNRHRPLPTAVSPSSSQQTRP
ncbi:hypothetical protein K457DRAFT_23453 [Linnemannia elongata AG-77]|uniref:Uncharacterized protein n=1 Tax=Linnemannia elongata AG-77 TaxID=1314771 RepID=A0A197JKP2_9FUNG|nr:hypothetical protein K457DRAFT_23453 [Linnemannia elongata AG-77]